MDSDKIFDKTLDRALNEVSAIAIDISREAANLLRDSVRQTKTLETKSTAIDIVTPYDKEAEALIIERLRASFPEHYYVAEEGEYQKGSEGDYVWYIDPIDGTNNFAHGIPFFAISLALYRGREPLFGLVHDPLRDEIFHASTGLGAYLSTRDEGPQPLTVSRAERLVHCLLASGFPYDRHTSQQDNVVQFAAFLKQAQGLRRMGAAALDLAYVAAGRLDGYWEYKLSSWDVAAGVLLVREAGGEVTDLEGKPFQLTRAPELIASNGRIHEQMLNVLAEVANTDAAY